MLRTGYLFFFFSWLVLAACSTSIPDDVQAAYDELDKPVDFNMDIKPLLSDRCYHCHGPDAATRKADLRLDTRDGLFEKTGNGAHAFQSNSLSKSTAIERILSDDPELKMPPPESNRELSARDKALLIKWVENGAEWKEHWAFIPPEKPQIPEINPEQGRVANPIDAFVLTRAEMQGLSQSAEADKERLLKRVTMDLTGLPPTLEEQDAFLADDSPDAYEKVVDALLASPAHAERLTLDWLDLARYADSHGFHADGERSMWPWRDWVIHAFEENKPYNEFVSEQLAGDMMPNASREQIIATAFNRNHPMTAEGGVVDEEFRLEYVANRTNTLGTAFLGLTLECARCHDHKFDPISQKEYYQFSAFFNNIRELGMTGDDGDFGPMVSLSSEETQEKIAFIDAQIEAQEKELATFESNARVIKAPALRQNFNRITKTDSSSFLDNNPRALALGPTELTEGVNGKATLFNDQDARLYIDKFGQFEAIDAFAVGLWVRVDEETDKTKVLIGNAGEKNNLWRGWDFYLDSTNHLSFRLINTMPHNMVHVKTKQTIPLETWTHVFVSSDGSMKASGITLAVDGEIQEVDVAYDRLYKNILPTNTARTLDQRGVLMGRSYRAFTGDNGTLKGAIDELVAYDFLVPNDQIQAVMESTKAGKTARIEAYSDPTLLSKYSKLNKLRKERLSIQDTVPELMAMEEMSAPRSTFVLTRGEYDKPEEQVFPGTASEIFPYDSSRAPNRLGLTEWLFDRNNPLTARVAVNRYWQMIFGQGIVTTVNDFGSQGALPSHPELLDYLAVEFMESGWDLRHLLKLMVMSETYRQSSRFSQDAYEKDPANIWLSYGPSYRQPAEFIRDNALATAGLLNDEIGGESAKPYQPDSLWVELGNFSYFLLYYHQDRDEDQYRRSMYTFIRRTSPPPNMILFDATNREVCTVTRERTNTPLQALVLLNDPQFVEASKALAYRLSAEGSVTEQIEKGFRLVLCRKPSQDELAVFKSLYEKQHELFEEDRSRAEEYLAVGDFKIPNNLDKTQLAALTVVTNTLYNMDEAYMKR